jgi:predicted TIM-barrel fold metal-dependent hydrolase
VDGLARLAALLTDLPGLTVVIDHLGAIDCSTTPPDYGVDELMASVARFSGAHVKFTTIPLGRLEHTGIDAKPIRRVMDLFGASRMMWGSDITQSAGTYAYMTALAHASVAGLSSAEQDSLLGGTAGQLYGRNWSAGLGSPRFRPFHRRSSQDDSNSARRRQNRHREHGNSGISRSPRRR